MKAAKKPFVVEIKNRRRLPRGERSIWATVDFQAAGEQVANESDATVPSVSLQAAAAPKAADIDA